ncbi:VOC family protein [candidate division KSB1 bacterium]|nr:VOC family protein [candidate division KSB1 bacterium]
MRDLAMEHIGLNVPEPLEMAEWYVKQLKMQIVRKQDTNLMHFLADADGRVVMEIFHNAAAPLPDYRQKSPLEFHLAFQADNLETLKDNLLTAKAMLVEDINTTPAGDTMMMLRDPWGVPIQFVKRSIPLKARS